MLDNQLFVPEKLSLIEFKFIKGQVDTPEEFNLDKVAGHQLENTLQLAFNIEEKLVRADLKVEIKTESKGGNPKESIGNFQLVFIYRVENLEELAKPDKNNLLDLHPALGNALSSITYSTARGILLTRLQGTALQNFVLPIINPNKLLLSK
ncbi:MAG: hypothetical protein ACXITV_01020 [Luteibaculaceae bacterium]